MKNRFGLTATRSTNAENTSKYVNATLLNTDQSHTKTYHSNSFSYYPCVFILKPNQHLHINKGRLHAFRKMSRNDLEPTDCHAKLRRRLVIDNNIKFDDLCISVAWDWMFLGASCDGMKDEISRTLECVDLAQIHGRQSLAIPQLSLIELAKFHLAKYHSSLAQSKYSYCCIISLRT